MQPQLSKYYFDLISKRQRGLVARLLRGLFTLFSLFFAVAVFARKVLYRRPFRPKAFTISVGNIVAGGTGKTPFTIFLADYLLKKYSVGILLRAYKAESEQAKRPVVFKKEAPPSLVGDEACLIARHLPELEIFCGKKVEGAKMADAVGLQAVVIDDGMQHLALARDLDIVMLDSENPFGYGYLLPRGLLREPISSLQRADLVVITHRNGQQEDPAVEEIIRRYTEAPLCRVRFAVCGLFDLNDRPVEIAQGAKVALFCAIAKPEQFRASIGALGYNVVYEQFFQDHAPLSSHDLQTVAQKAKFAGAACLICTEKDRVKLSGACPEMPVYWLKIGIEMMTPAVWQQFCKERLPT